MVCGGSYSSAEMQSVYIHSPNRLGKQLQGVKYLLIILSKQL